ncbi:hypothetical protein BJ138DRAFT_1017710 [Hygrophoropsis aurantiaca]|uniref:Uncharacterized protein n=1 Tax=Hygrophoropsis aurantiaca TaxID=72124 RepID=A0ACB7ZX16_9AGAM|nr:hypothetical protein BJ138DRAFT_1017710 [Hygrophoropsis aurantiaca]
MLPHPPDTAASKPASRRPSKTSCANSSASATRRRVTPRFAAFCCPFLLTRLILLVCSIHPWHSLPAFLSLARPVIHSWHGTACLSHQTRRPSKRRSDATSPCRRASRFIPRWPDITARATCELGLVVPVIYHLIAVCKEGGVRTEKAYSFPKESGRKGEVWWSMYQYRFKALMDKVRGRTPHM